MVMGSQQATTISKGCSSKPRLHRKTKKAKSTESFLEDKLPGLVLGRWEIWPDRDRVGRFQTEKKHGYYWGRTM